MQIKVSEREAWWEIIGLNAFGRGTVKILRAEIMNGPG